MRVRAFAVVACTLFLVIGDSVAGEEEIQLILAPTYVKHGLAELKTSFSRFRMTEAQAIAIGRINARLDLDSHIDCIETPLGDAIRYFFQGSAIVVAVDPVELKKVSVTLDQLVTYQPKEKQPLRKCLHDVFDPLGLNFVVCPTGILITAAPKKAEK